METHAPIVPHLQEVIHPIASVYPDIMKQILIIARNVATFVLLAAALVPVTHATLLIFVNLTQSAPAMTDTLMMDHLYAKNVIFSVQNVSAVGIIAKFVQQILLEILLRNVTAT
jgi:hypothetical protein